VDRGEHLDQLIAEADRLDELADTAELMGDPAGAARLHDAAVRRRERAMADLDDRSPREADGR
jgi:hypothetical protein